MWIAEEENDQEYANYLKKAQHHNMSISKRDLNPNMQTPDLNLQQDHHNHINQEREISVLFSPLIDNLECSGSSLFSACEENHHTSDVRCINLKM